MKNTELKKPSKKDNVKFAIYIILLITVIGCQAIYTFSTELKEKYGMILLVPIFVFIAWSLFTELRNRSSK